MPRPKEYNVYTNEDIENVIANWWVTGKYSETSRQLNIPESSVRRIILDNKDSAFFKEIELEKRIEFNTKASKIIDKAMVRLDKELDNDKPIPINSLSVVIGTLHDKINNVGSEIKVIGTPDIEVKVVDNSNLEKVMYDEKN